MENKITRENTISTIVGQFGCRIGVGRALELIRFGVFQKTSLRKKKEKELNLQARKHFTLSTKWSKCGKERETWRNW